ncbi:MAG: arginine--tRNA ligase [Candidatus Pacearchaeota archaeon]|jgi:arginyl-tRNA synthetase
MEQSIIDLISKRLNLNKETIEKAIEIPPNLELGDYAFPCFILAKQFKKSPMDIASELSLWFNNSLPKEIEKTEAKGPYVNFFLNKISLVEEVLKKALNDDFGKAKENQKILVEHTSINPNASPHVGRTRNSIIADSIVRILRFRGNKVETHYYVNDVSKQIAMLALVFKPNHKFADMLNNYISISKKVSENPELEKEIFDLLEKFEKKDKKTIDLFRKIVKICIEGQKEIFKKFGITFDFFDYESKYIGKASKDLIEKFKKTGKLFEDKDNRLVLDLSHTDLHKKMKSPVFVLARSNGTSLYGLRDIAYTLDKMKRGRNIIILGEDHKLYFDQIKESLKLLNSNAPEPVHYSFVLIQTSTGNKKMSTRRGELVLLEDFFRETVKKAQVEIKKRKTKGDAEKIAIAAIKYAMLRNDSNKNIIFSWENSLNFEGESGPYLQYSYARASSILRKVKKAKSKLFRINSLEEIEIKLAKKIADFPTVVESAESHLSPNLIANYSFELAQTFNEFYHACPVIGNENESFRIKLVEAFRLTIKKSLYLLGIEVMEEM